MGAESPEELFGKTDFDFYPKKLASKYRKDEVEIIESGKAKIDIIEQVIDRDHNIHWYSTSKLPLKDSNGRIIGIMGIGREVTRLIKEKKALRKAKIAAEKADQLKTSFLANLSHEVRTPLNGILGFSQFLKQVGTNNPKTDKYIDYIIHNGKRLLNLITDIIDISKIDAGQLRLSITDLSVDDLMNKLERSAMELLAGENKKEISLKLQVDGAEKSVMQSTDAQRLEQILRILISNAVKFTDRGTITLGYTLKAGVIEYYVRDTGIGIDPKDFSQVFERFIQADNSLSRQYEGVGLGLSIASELVRLLHGEIDLKSKVNKGTEFTVSFPLKPQFKKVSD